MMIRELSPGPQMLQRRAPSTAGSLASLRLIIIIIMILMRIIVMRIMIIVMSTASLRLIIVG